MEFNADADLELDSDPNKSPHYRRLSDGLVLTGSAPALISESDAKSRPKANSLSRIDRDADRNGSFLFKFERTHSIVQDMAVDLNGLNRMPITAIHITSHAEQKNLRRK